MCGRHFRRQQVIDGFIVDVYCHAARLVIEVDGIVHDQQGAYDAVRDQMLAACALRILRVTNDDVRYQLKAALERIALACATANR